MFCLFQDINDSNQYEELQKNIQEQRHYRYGKCYTFHPGEKMRQNGIEKIVIKLKWVPQSIFTPSF